MADDPGEDASFAAQHAAVPRLPLRVATTDGSTKYNTIRIPLVPVACWRLNDPGFAFDSSFVAPAFRDELASLSGIVAANPECPAALFGHCDPAGSDALNKTLGDRRAIAVYALLTRQPDLWADLCDHSQVGDTWDLRVVQTILASVPDGNGDPYYAGPVNGSRDAATTDAVRRFQADKVLPVNGDPEGETRKALFRAYMDWLCTPASPVSAPDSAPASTDATSSTASFRMQPGDFLGGAGAQPGDLPKMALQSCGKFNPVLLLARSEMGGEDTTDGASKTQRNADDAPNRRVVMFLFEKGATVEASVWPCPKVKDAHDPCKEAFWPDGDQRRKNGDMQRVYAETRDTMACRFYDRFARRSPCENATVRGPIWIRLGLTPRAAAAATYSLRLRSSPTGYDVAKVVASSFVSTGRRWTCGSRTRRSSTAIRWTSSASAVARKPFSQTFRTALFETTFCPRPNSRWAGSEAIPVCRGRRGREPRRTSSCPCFASKRLTL